jgi:Tol biopolymer transport system component
MTGSHADDAVIDGFERRMAAVEALIPEPPMWRAPEEVANRRMRVVAGTNVRRQRESAGRSTRRWGVLAVGAAAALAVTAVAVAVVLMPPAAGPGRPSALPTESVPASPSGPSGVPASLRGDALLVEDTVDGNTDLYLMPLDGSPRIRLTNDPAPDRDGAWTRDGKLIVYASGDDGERRLYMTLGDAAIGADGAGPRPLAGEGSEIEGFDAYSPHISPDGRSIAFLRGVAAERSELWVSTLDGSDARRLVGPNRPFIADPRWTADGRSIYLLVDDSAGGAIGIHRVDPATGATTRLDDCPLDDSGFALSPDGSRIAWQSDCGGGGLWLADADFTDARRWYGSLTVGYPLDWSPDGRWLAYSPPGALQLLDTTLTDPTPIALEQAEGPRWRPRPSP